MKLALVRPLVALGCTAWLLGATPARAADDDPLQVLRTRPTGMEEDKWRIARREAARELGNRRPTPEVVDALIEIVESERYDALLSISMDSLARLGDPRALPALERVYADRSIDSFVRADAATAIRKLGGTPRDDARLTGEAEVGKGSSDRVLGGPQLGAMGEASAPEDAVPEVRAGKPLPANLRAREREFGFVLGALDLRVDTLAKESPFLADAGLSSFATYVDERHQFGWTVRARLTGDFRSGDLTVLENATGSDDGDVWWLRQSLEGAADVHYYFGRTDFHVFAELGLSQRVSHISVESRDGDTSGSLSDTRFALDVIPAAGLGWGRWLNAGSDILVDAIIHTLKSENILARDMEEVARREIREALYRRAGTWSSYPRLAAVVDVLRRNGLLAREPGVRVIHRLRSVIEDPSYVHRMRGLVARTGFLYGLPVGQDDFFRREGDALGAPYALVLGGFQLGREREVGLDTRFWYDAIGTKGFSVDAGVRYTRYFHTEYDDYRGHWFVGLRGGASQRKYEGLPDGAPDEVLGYRALALAGYGYGFRRASEISVAGNAGMDSGGFIVGIGLSLRIGIAQSSIVNPAVGAGVAASTGAAAKAAGGARR